MSSGESLKTVLPAQLCTVEVFTSPCFALPLGANAFLTSLGWLGIADCALPAPSAIFGPWEETVLCGATVAPGKESLRPLCFPEPLELWRWWLTWRSSAAAGYGRKTFMLAVNNVTEHDTGASPSNTMSLRSGRLVAGT